MLAIVVQSDSIALSIRAVESKFHSWETVLKQDSTQRAFVELSTTPLPVSALARMDKPLSLVIGKPQSSYGIGMGR